MRSAARPPVNERDGEAADDWVRGHLPDPASRSSSSRRVWARRRRSRLREPRRGRSDRGRQSVTGGEIQVLDLLPTPSLLGSATVNACCHCPPSRLFHIFIFAVIGSRLPSSLRSPRSPVYLYISMRVVPCSGERSEPVVGKRVHASERAHEGRGKGDVSHPTTTLLSSSPLEHPSLGVAQAELMRTYQR